MPGCQGLGEHSWGRTSPARFHAPGFKMRLLLGCRALWEGAVVSSRDFSMLAGGTGWKAADRKAGWRRRALQRERTNQIWIDSSLCEQLSFFLMTLRGHRECADSASNVSTSRFGEDYLSTPASSTWAVIVLHIPPLLSHVWAGGGKKKKKWDIARMLRIRVLSQSPGFAHPSTSSCVTLEKSNLGCEIRVIITTSLVFLGELTGKALCQVPGA